MRSGDMQETDESMAIRESKISKRVPGQQEQLTPQGDKNRLVESGGESIHKKHKERRGN